MEYVVVDEKKFEELANDPQGYLATVLKKAEGEYPFTEWDQKILKNISEWGN